MNLVTEESDLEILDDSEKESKIAVQTIDLSVYFKDRIGIENINIKIRKNRVTAIIGPSGCGKSTFLRSLNLMHDMTPSARVFGEILIHGNNITDSNSVDIRKKVGMVFQKPNPFPTMSIYDNVAYGLRVRGIKQRAILDEKVEAALRNSALWDEVKDELKKPAVKLSGGQQQRLCIARTVVLRPEVILMDEPCSALDPISSHKIEELIMSLKSNYTIVIVTHNMQQAQRISDKVAFMYLGELVEFDSSENIFKDQQKELTRNYVNGHFG